MVPITAIRHLQTLKNGYSMYQVRIDWEDSKFPYFISVVATDELSAYAETQKLYGVWVATTPPTKEQIE